MLARFLRRHMDAVVQRGGPQSVVPRPAPSVSPGNFLEIRVLGPGRNAAAGTLGGTLWSLLERALQAVRIHQEIAALRILPFTLRLQLFLKG